MSSVMLNKIFQFQIYNVLTTARLCDIDVSTGNYIYEIKFINIEAKKCTTKKYDMSEKLTENFQLAFILFEYYSLYGAITENQDFVEDEYNIDLRTKTGQKKYEALIKRHEFIETILDMYNKPFFSAFEQLGVI